MAVMRAFLWTSDVRARLAFTKSTIICHFAVSEGEALYSGGIEVIVDANYALTDIVIPALNLQFARDAMGDIAVMGNAAGANPATETYSYDPLYRLTGIYNASGITEEAYTYSKTGDRLSKTASGLDSGIYSYQSGTPHLSSIGNASRVYDADGNTTGSVVAGNTYGFGYSGRNRMTVVQLNSSTLGAYTYNALGLRTANAATLPAAISQRFVYDEVGQLLSEYGSDTRDWIVLNRKRCNVTWSGAISCNGSLRSHRSVQRVAGECFSARPQCHRPGPDPSIRAAVHRRSAEPQRTVTALVRFPFPIHRAEAAPCRFFRSHPQDADIASSAPDAFVY